MSRWLLLLLVLLTAACNISEKDSGVFDSDKLQGRYKVDLTPFVTEALGTQEEKDGWEKMGQGLMVMALSSVEMEFSFYEGNRAVVHMDGGLVDFAMAFSDEPMKKTHELTYKVEQDSVLYVKGEQDQDFRKCGVIQQYSESYDHFKLLVGNEGEKKFYLDMHKVKE
ncbi:hypothetical protein V6R21_05730 [Limibacter armeniacum]|uniref:hypothetical protein n=1 Tax=Limibacter armeniacum TaxID=466084 RepID=UPI002FE600F5